MTKDPTDIFTTEEDSKKLAVLHLELDVNGKAKKVEFGVHSNSGIEIKSKSNHFIL